MFIKATEGFGGPTFTLSVIHLREDISLNRELDWSLSILLSLLPRPSRVLGAAGTCVTTTSFLYGSEDLNSCPVLVYECSYLIKPPLSLLH